MQGVHHSDVQYGNLTIKEDVLKCSVSSAVGIELRNMAHTFCASTSPASPPTELHTTTAGS